MCANITSALEKSLSQMSQGILLLILWTLWICLFNIFLDEQIAEQCSQENVDRSFLSGVFGGVDGVSRMKWSRLGISSALTSSALFITVRPLLPLAE